MSRATLFIFLAVFSTAYLAAFAASSTQFNNDDPKCSRGTHTGFETNVFQYNVPYNLVHNKIGSFFHSEWYTGPVNFTHGRDNTVGATRTATLAGIVYTEKLIAYVRSPGTFSMRLVLATAPVAFGGVVFSSYTVDLGAMSICGGRATYIEILVTYCADKPNKAYDIFDNYNRGTVGGVAKGLNALIFAGSCPNGLE